MLLDRSTSEDLRVPANCGTDIAPLTSDEDTILVAHYMGTDNPFPLRLKSDQ